MKTTMGRREKSISIDDLASGGSIKRPVLIRIQHEGQQYDCEVEPIEDNRAILRIEFVPDKYHVPGLLFSGHDETKKGLELRAMLAHRNMSPTYFDNRISYARVVGEVSAGTIRRFVLDAVCASKDVDAMLLRYVNNIPKKIDNAFGKYIA